MMTRWRQFDQPINALVQGASRGIGLGFVKALLDDELTASVIATSRDPGSSEALVRLAQQDERLVCVPMDIGDESAVVEAARIVREHVDRLDLILNVTGVLHDTTTGLSPEKRLQDLNQAHLAQSFAINAIGPMLVLRHLHELLPRDRRSVVASLSARVGSIGDNRLGGWYGYRASKAALNQGMRTASIELARRWKQAICVVVHPGTVDTQLSEPFQGRVPEGKLFDVGRAADQLLDVLDGLDATDTGCFFDWAGEPIVW